MSSAATASTPPPSGAGSARPARLHSLLVEFETPEALKAAAARVRDAGYTRWDTHTPFPVHGIDGAMGIRPTRLPLIVFVCGLIGCLTGVLLVWYTNAAPAHEWKFLPTFVQGYQYLISGKPAFSLPANIPVIFELTVLLSAFGAVFGMLVLNDLPRPYNPLLEHPRFARATSDRFFLVVDAADPAFSRAQTSSLLGSLGGVVEEVHERTAPEPVPAWTRPATVIAVCLLLIPPSIVVKMRTSRAEEPRIHIVQDMDNQEKFKAQRASTVFADGRIARLPVGATPANTLGLTVARGEARLDDHFYRGLVNGTYAEKFPTHRPDVQLNDEFLRRGQRQYAIYCTPCHGYDGSGNGVVNLRAVELAEPGWIAAASLYDDERRGRVVGHLFNSITNGVRTMPAYAEQLSERDRWAIVAYVRALQWAHTATLADVPAEKRAELAQRAAPAESGAGNP